MNWYVGGQKRSKHLPEGPCGALCRRVLKIVTGFVQKTLRFYAGFSFALIDRYGIIKKARRVCFVFTGLIRTKYRGTVRRAGRTETRFVRILTFPTPNRTYGYERKWYEDSADIAFEGRVFQGIRDYDEYLSFKFGDYRTLPPEEQRKAHPVSELRLTRLRREL